ncbi:MAG: T9SS type A sorting domain-containing protein [Calditrichaeota bacterium]|nr:T9SS type A sorting domain-containing protein [Calditrichota bacterium]
MTRILSAFNLLKRMGFAVLLLGGAAIAQPPQTIWSLTIGNGGDFQISDANITGTGNVVFVGSYSSDISGDRFILAGSVSAVGDCLWTVVLDTFVGARAEAIIPLVQGGFQIAGTQIDSIEEWQADALFCELGPNGELLASTRVGSNRTEEISSAVQDDNEYLIGCGFRDPAGTDLGDDLYLAKVDSNFGLLWERGYRPSEDAYTHGTSIVNVRTGGYAALGFTQTNEPNSSQLYLVRVDINGDTMWTRMLGDPNVVDESVTIDEKPNGGFLISGNTSEPGFSFCAIRLISVDTVGEVEWEQVLPLPCFRRPIVRDICLAQGGGWLIAGGILTPDLVTHEFLIAGIDDQGENFWSTTFDPSGDGIATRVVDAQSDGYFVLGSVLHGSPLRHAIQVLRISSEAQVVSSLRFPLNYSTLQGFPNPFNALTTINFVVTGRREPVTLDIVDLMGRRTATLLNEVVFDRGTYEVSFDGTGQPSGAYFCRLRTNNKTSILKLVLIK